MKPEKSTVFNKTYTDYLAQISNIDFSTKQDRIGVKIEGREIVVPFFGKPYRFSSSEIADPFGQRPDFGRHIPSVHRPAGGHREEGRRSRRA